MKNLLLLMALVFLVACKDENTLYEFKAYEEANESVISSSSVSSIGIVFQKSSSSNGMVVTFSSSSQEELADTVFNTVSSSSVSLSSSSESIVVIENNETNESSENNQSSSTSVLIAASFKPLSLTALAGTKASVQLHAEGATKYEIQNLPSFIHLNTKTGEVSIDASASYYGQQYFDVKIADDFKSAIIEKGLKVEIYRDQNRIAGKLKRNKIVPKDAQNTLSSISGRDAISLIYDKVNNYWKAVLCYYTSYGHNNQLKVMNLTTLKEDNNYQDFLESTAINAVNTVIAYDLDTYIRFSGKLTKYSNLTGEISLIGDVPTILGGGILYPSNVLGLDGKLVLGGEKNGKISIAEYDTQTKTYTLWEGLNVDATHPDGDRAANRNAAADKTHLYQSTNGNGTGYRVYTMDRATSTGKKLANCPTWVTVAQGKYGCWVYMPSGSTDAQNQPIDGGVYWLYEGELIRATNGLNQDTCPWDNKGEEFVVHSAAPIDKPYKVLNQGHIPIPGSSDTSMWFKKEVSSEWKKVPIHNVKNYPIRLDNIATIGSKIISVGDAYTGFSVKDIETKEVNNYTGLFSYYAHLTMNGKFYMSGYPSGMLYEYNPNLPWDNSAGDYNPNMEVIKTNPKFIGYTRHDSPNIKGVSVGGTGGGQHKNYVLLEGDNNILWAFGEWERDGKGLGVTSIDLNDNYRMKGYRDEKIMQNHTPRSGVATKDYLVVLCETFSGDATLDLAVMDRKTQQFHNIALPSNAVMKWSSITRGSTIIGYGINKVLIASANDKRELVLIGVDIEKEKIIYNNSIPKSYTSSGGSIEKMSDGNIYLGLNGVTVVVEPNHGWIEEVSDMGLDGQRVQASDKNVYFVNGTKTYVINEPFVKTGFKEISKNEGDFFDTISAWRSNGSESTVDIVENRVNISINKVSDSSNQGELLLKTIYNFKAGNDYTVRFNAKINSGIVNITGFRTYNISSYTPLDYTLVNGVNEFTLKGDGSNKFPRFRFDTTQKFTVEISDIVIIDNLEG